MREEHCRGNSLGHERFPQAFGGSLTHRRMGRVSIRWGRASKTKKQFQVGMRALKHQLWGQRHVSARPANKKAAPLLKARPVRISVLHVLAFIVDFVGFFLPLNFSPGGCTREEGFMVTLTINKDDP
jgi:hypothetical protein